MAEGTVWPLTYFTNYNSLCHLYDAIYQDLHQILITKIESFPAATDWIISAASTGCCEALKRWGGIGVAVIGVEAGREPLPTQRFARARQGRRAQRLTQPAWLPRHATTIILSLKFFRWNVADRLQKSAVVKPINQSTIQALQTPPPQHFATDLAYGSLRSCRVR